MRKPAETDMQIATLAKEGMTQGQIAERLGMSRRTVIRRMQRPEMAALIKAARAGAGKAFIAAEKKQCKEFEESARKTATEDIKKLSLVAITPAMIVSRLWQLAMMDANETRGNIQGQQQALDSIWIKCGFQGQAPTVEELRDAAPDVYRAGWMPQ